MEWSEYPGKNDGSMVFTEFPDVQNSFTAHTRVPFSHIYGEDPLCTTGNYIISAELGTGDYEDVYGAGTLDMCRDEEDNLYGTLEGLKSNDNKE